MNKLTMGTDFGEYNHFSHSPGIVYIVGYQLRVGDGVTGCGTYGTAG
jgi:hypothetical protein